MTSLKSAREHVKAWAKEFLPCVPPCDSLGVCENCCDVGLIMSGVEKMLAHLESAAGEFDATAACDEFEERWENVDRANDACEGARWQFEQDKARIGHDREQKIFWHDRAMGLEDKVTQLEALVKDLRRSVEYCGKDMAIDAFYVERLLEKYAPTNSSTIESGDEYKEQR